MREQIAYDKVLKFAKEAHAGQKRKYTGEDYIVHPIEVSQIVKRHRGSLPMQLAALLHDVLEDTDVTALELFEFLITVDVLTSDEIVETQKLVVELTDIYTKESYPDWNRKKRKEMEAKRLGGISQQGQTIKLADLMSNTPSIVEKDPSFAKVYLREKEEMLKEMRGGNAILRKKVIEATKP